jgi:hypothetical protein
VKEGQERQRRSRRGGTSGGGQASRPSALWRTLALPAVGGRGSTAFSFVRTGLRSPLCALGTSLPLVRGPSCSLGRCVRGCWTRRSSMGAHSKLPWLGRRRLRRTVAARPRTRPSALGCIWRPGTARSVPAKQRVPGPPRFARSGVNLVIQRGIAERTVPYPDCQ